MANPFLVIVTTEDFSFMWMGGVVVRSFLGSLPDDGQQDDGRTTIFWPTHRRLFILPVQAVAFHASSSFHHLFQVGVQIIPASRPISVSGSRDRSQHSLLRCFAWTDSIQWSTSRNFQSNNGWLLKNESIFGWNKKGNKQNNPHTHTKKQTKQIE